MWKIVCLVLCESPSLEIKPKKMYMEKDWKFVKFYLCDLIQCSWNWQLMTFMFTFYTSVIVIYDC